MPWRFPGPHHPPNAKNQASNRFRRCFVQDAHQSQRLYYARLRSAGQDKKGTGADFFSRPEGFPIADLRLRLPRSARNDMIADYGRESAFIGVHLRFPSGFRRRGRQPAAEQGGEVLPERGPVLLNHYDDPARRVAYGDGGLALPFFEFPAGYDDPDPAKTRLEEFAFLPGYTRMREVAKAGTRQFFARLGAQAPEVGRPGVNIHGDLLPRHHDPFIPHRGAVPQAALTAQEAKGRRSSGVPPGDHGQRRQADQEGDNGQRQHSSAFRHDCTAGTILPRATRKATEGGAIGVAALRSQ
jgi:hypothetical protein